MTRKFVHEETGAEIEVLNDIQAEALKNEGFKEVEEEPKKKK
jgi:hypothetical protein